MSDAITWLIGAVCAVIVMGTIISISEKRMKYDITNGSIIMYGQDLYRCQKVEVK